MGRAANEREAERSRGEKAKEERWKVSGENPIHAGEKSKTVSPPWHGQHLGPDDLLWGLPSALLDVSILAFTRWLPAAHQS